MNNTSKKDEPNCLECPYEYTCDWDESTCWYMKKKVIEEGRDMRLTKLIAGFPHGAEGRSEEHLTGCYCRGEFEATALVERLYQYEEIGLEPDEVANLAEEHRRIQVEEQKPKLSPQGEANRTGTRSWVDHYKQRFERRR